MGIPLSVIAPLTQLRAGFESSSLEVPQPQAKSDGRDGATQLCMPEASR